MSSSSESPDSLWPKFRDDPEVLRSPISIIKEQASQLAPRTQGLVVAKVMVDPETDKADDVVWHIFLLSCPTLGNYSVHLFNIRTQLTALYPVSFTSTFLTTPGGNSAKWDSADQSELYGALREIFGHDKTITAIESMMAHAGAEPKKQAPKAPEVGDDDVPF
jgi:hypothetical protein